MENQGLLIILAISIVVGILLFLLLRELVCWYWKINLRIELAEEQNLLLKQLVKHFKEEKSRDDPGIIN